MPTPAIATGIATNLSPSMPIERTDIQVIEMASFAPAVHFLSGRDVDGVPIMREDRMGPEAPVVEVLRGSLVWHLQCIRRMYRHIDRIKYVLPIFAPAPEHRMADDATMAAVRRAHPDQPLGSRYSDELEYLERLIERHCIVRSYFRARIRHAIRQHLRRHVGDFDRATALYGGSCVEETTLAYAESVLGEPLW